jgi:hypothetical protein
MTERVVSGTYETLSVNSPQALEVCGRGRATAGTATAAVRVQVRAIDWVGESPRLRSNGPKARVLLASSPRPLQPGEGGPIVGGECIGLALPTATKIKIGRSGPDRCRA